MDFRKLQRILLCSRCSREYKTLISKDYDTKKEPFRDYHDKNNVCDREDCFKVFKGIKKGIGKKG